MHSLSSGQLRGGANTAKGTNNNKKHPEDKGKDSVMVQVVMALVTAPLRSFYRCRAREVFIWQGCVGSFTESATSLEPADWYRNATIA
jgi:hypothetical protein